MPPSASAYLVLLAALPALHTCALRLMQTLLWAGQAALLLHHTSMARLLSSLLQQVAASAAADSAPAAMQLRQQVTATGPPLCVDTARQAIRHLAHFTEKLIKKKVFRISVFFITFHLFSFFLKFQIKKVLHGPVVTSEMAFNTQQSRRATGLCKAAEKTG